MAWTAAGFPADARDDVFACLVVPRRVQKPHEQLSLMSTFLLNFTDVDTGRRSGATVMPGLTFGIRF